MTELTDRAALRRQLFRLINTDEQDPAMLEYDPSDDQLEGVHHLLQRGARLAQLHLVHAGRWDHWMKTSDPLVWSGSDAVDGGTYADLPADFLRAASNDYGSAIRNPGQGTWGREVNIDHRNRRSGSGYYFRNNQLWLLRRANPPAGLVLDYIARVRDLMDQADADVAGVEPIDFPALDRELIVAFAAVEASRQHWFLGGPEEKQLLREHLKECKHEAWEAARPSQTPRRIQPAPVLGGRWYN